MNACTVSPLLPNLFRMFWNRSEENMTNDQIQAHIIKHDTLTDIDSYSEELLQKLSAAIPHKTIDLQKSFYLGGISHTISLKAAGYSFGSVKDETSLPLTVRMFVIRLLKERLTAKEHLAIANVLREELGEYTLQHLLHAAAEADPKS